eukprot:TRINITY_DN23685_c0_g1_i1.p1 TRINITY_DN23685_c0_g1~~TRINITY_DN23685_c0_g1_i1.p1  ORF type:complete len:197 (+),score=73.91 TRINITY_DN23685_c0_g1_i1:242-832(+)
MGGDCSDERPDKLRAAEAEKDAAKRKEQFDVLWNSYDADGSGCLDEEELKPLLLDMIDSTILMLQENCAKVQEESQKHREALQQQGASSGPMGFMLGEVVNSMLDPKLAFDPVVARLRQLKKETSAKPAAEVTKEFITRADTDRDKKISRAEFEQGVSDWLKKQLDDAQAEVRSNRFQAADEVLKRGTAAGRSANV